MGESTAPTRQNLRDGVRASKNRSMTAKSKTLEPKGVSEDLKRRIVEHYEGTLKRFGPTARGMDWKDARSQRLRYEVLCRVRDLQGLTIHEVGAGSGHLVDYLGEAGIEAHYSGSDLSQAMVRAARRRHPEIDFEQRDILGDTGAGLYDVVLCSGLFHVKLDHTEEEWRRFMEPMLRRMFDMCRVAIAFNAMRDDVDYRLDTLYYPAVGQLVEFCRRDLSRAVVARLDYPLHEQTLYVYRTSPFGEP